MKNDVLYIVIPCYNEEDVLPEIVRRLGDKLTSLVDAGLIDPESRVLLVDDGSTDRTWSMICDICQQDSRFSIWCVGGLILLGLGVVGEYIGKIYLETKARPRYLIKEIIEKKEQSL